MTAEDTSARVDGMAHALCAIETRSKAATLEEVADGIQRWTRHRYEAARLLDELRDYGFEVQPVSTQPIDDEREALISAAHREADRRYGATDWTDGPGSSPYRRVDFGRAGAFVDGALWRSRHRGPITDERPYSEAVDIEHGAWETDDIEERAHDLLAVVRHRRGHEATEAARTNHTDRSAS